MNYEHEDTLVSSELKKLTKQKKKFFEELSNEDPAYLLKLLKEEFESLKKPKTPVEKEYVSTLQKEEDTNDKCMNTIRSAIFQLTDSLMNIKNKKAKFDISTLESILIDIFTLKLLSENQNQRLIKQYLRLTTMFGINPQEELTGIARTKSSNIPLCKKSKSRKAKCTEEEDKIIISKAPHLRKESISTQESETLSEIATPNNDIYESEKDCCIICMDKQREIVYLPCAHLITCTNCGPLLTQCPICTQRITQNLKIYWS